MLLKVFFYVFVFSLLITHSGCAALRPHLVFEKSKACNSLNALQVRYAGTTTLLFSDGQTKILLDGFFSRPPLWQWVTGPFVSDQERIRVALERLEIEKLDVIPVFHSHFDHVMDTSEVAKITDAKILGSASTARVAEGAQVPASQIMIADAEKSYRFGRFEIHMLPGKHMSLGAVAQVLQLDGDILQPFTQPAHLLQYREGGTYTIAVKHPDGNSLLQGTQLTSAAQQIDFEVHTLFLTTPGFHRLSLKERQAFTHWIKQLSVQRVVAVHWDDFSRSLALPLQPFPSFLDDFESDFKALRSVVPQGTPLLLWPAWHQDCFS